MRCKKIIIDAGILLDLILGKVRKFRIVEPKELPDDIKLIVIGGCDILGYAYEFIVESKEFDDVKVIEDIPELKLVLQEININQYPSCECCPKAILPNPAQTCYDARHKYPSECPKDIWFKNVKEN